MSALVPHPSSAPNAICTSISPYPVKAHALVVHRAAYCAMGRPTTATSASHPLSSTLLSNVYFHAMLAMVGFMMLVWAIRFAANAITPVLVARISLVTVLPVPILLIFLAMKLA